MGSQEKNRQITFNISKVLEFDRGFFLRLKILSGIFLESSDFLQQKQK